MSTHVKNIIYGAGNVFVTIPPVRNYKNVERCGFAGDVRNLAADRGNIAAGIHRHVKMANVKYGKK